MHTGASRVTLAMLALGAGLLWGGIPLQVGDVIVGAIGTGGDDEAQAEVGAKAFKKLPEAHDG